MTDRSAIPMLALSLINDFELRCDGKLIPTLPSAQRLICFLALHNKPLRRSYVGSALWLESSEARAKASLRSSLWRVPTPSGVAVVKASKTHMLLNPAIEVDLHSVIARVHAVLDGNAADRDVVGAARELCAIGADILPGWYDDWVIMERERFRQLRLHALDQIGEHLLQTGRYADASQVGLSCVKIEPLRETAHRLLVRIHLREGNMAEAIRQYRHFASMLRDELGVPPSAAMRELVSCIVAHDRGGSDLLVGPTKSPWSVAAVGRVVHRSQ
jgi:DNA-binding SARP family transcriptional activator